MAYVPRWKSAARKGKKRSAPKNMKRAAPALYKAVKQIARQQAFKAQETKYVADYGTPKPVPQTDVTPAGFHVVGPPGLGQGLQEHQRIGDKVKPVKCRVHYTFYFDTISTQNNADVEVNLWIVSCKGAGSTAAIAALPAGQFLKTGTGINADPNSTSVPFMLTAVNNFILNNDQYTLCKHYRFRMRKGIGNSTGVNTAGEVAPTGVPANEDLKRITYSWTPPGLQYQDGAITNPTDHNLVGLVWAVNADGSGYTTNLQYSVRNEMWYKDA